MLSPLTLILTEMVTTRKYRKKQDTFGLKVFYLTTREFWARSKVAVARKQSWPSGKHFIFETERLCRSLYWGRSRSASPNRG